MASRTCTTWCPHPASENFGVCCAEQTLSMCTIGKQPTFFSRSAIISGVVLPFLTSFSSLGSSCSKRFAFAFLQCKPPCEPGRQAELRCAGLFCRQSEHSAPLLCVQHGLCGAILLLGNLLSFLQNKQASCKALEAEGQDLTDTHLSSHLRDGGLRLRARRQRQLPYQAQVIDAVDEFEVEG